MKIIRSGTAPGNREMHGTCQGCKCQIECNASEVSHDSDLREKGDPYVTCPTAGCGRMIWVKMGPHPKTGE